MNFKNKDLKAKFQTMTNEQLFKWPTWIFLIALGITIFVFLIYFINFHSGFSNEQSIWGNFGDFVGGTLNPILSFIALIALLLTISLQSRELEATRMELEKTALANETQAIYIATQQQRDDLFRLIHKLAERINNNYNQNFLDDDKSIHEMMIGRPDVTSNKSLETLYENSNNTNTKTYQILRYIETDLRTLASLIQDYEEVSLKSYGSTPLPSFYKSEYKEFVAVMHNYSIFKPDIAEFYCKK